MFVLEVLEAFDKPFLKNSDLSYVVSSFMIVHCFFKELRKKQLKITLKTLYVICKL